MRFFLLFPLQTMGRPVFLPAVSTPAGSRPSRETARKVSLFSLSLFPELGLIAPVPFPMISILSDCRLPRSFFRPEGDAREGATDRRFPPPSVKRKSGHRNHSSSQPWWVMRIIANFSIFLFSDRIETASKFPFFSPHINLG